MKVFKKILISLVILAVVLVVAGIIFIKTFDVNRFKLQIISQISKSLGRSVDFQNASLGISLRQGISLKIINLVIADDPAFGKDSFFTVKNISLAVDALGYIFQKKVNVPNVLIESPHLTIIRQKDGVFNVQTLAKPAEAGKEVIKSAPALVGSSMAIPAILINSLRGTNGTILFVDHSFDPALSLEISDLRFSLNKISLTEPFPFFIEACVLSAKRNIRIEGKAQVDLKANEITILELKGTTDLSDILLGKIPVSFPMTKGAVLPESLKGKVQVTLDKFIAGPKGLTALAADAVLADGVLQFKEIASVVKDIRMHIKITEKNILLDKVAATIGEGVINGTGSLDDYLSGQNYSFEASAQNIKLQDLIVQDKSQVKIEGLVMAKARFKGQGFTPLALQSNCSGGIDLSITKAKLKDINVLRTVLDKVSLIPGLAQKVEAGLPERFKQKLAQKDTVLLDIKIPVTIENGQFMLKETVLGAEEFMFKGEGQAGFDGAYTMQGSFLIPQELSAGMVAQVPELQYLLNDEQQIFFPLKISGMAGEVQFSVDVEYIAKKLVVDQAKKQIFKAIDKFLGQKDEQSTQQDAPQQTQTDESSKKPTTEESVGKILRGIFK